MKSCFLSVFLLFVALSSSFGQSIILFDELNAANSGSDSVTKVGPLGESFSTGASAVSLTDVMVKLNIAQNNGGTFDALTRRRAGGGSTWVQPAASSSPAVTIALYSNNVLRPGTLLAQLGTVPDSSLPSSGAYQNFDIPVNPPVPLTANTRYWILITSSNNSVAAWAWTPDVTGIGSANEYTFFQEGVYPNVGASDGPYQLRVTAAPPATPLPTVTNVFDQAAATSNLTPGMPIQVVGTGFGNSTTDSATVMIGTEAAPILRFINSTNLIVQVPVEALLGATTLTATYKGQTSTAFNIQLVALAPEIEPFSFYDTSNNLITAAHPAIPGSQVYLLAIGLGTTNPAQVTNTIATAQAPTTQQVQVMVGGKMVQPSYAGLFVGGTPGYYQVAFTVPVDAAMGNQPVTLSEGGLTSNSQTLVVAPPIPIINAIVNGATFQAGTNPQAANSFVSLFGQNFGTENTASNIFPAKSFDGLSVLVNGTAIPLGRAS